VTSRKVCSDNLFAIEKSSGTRAWIYTGGIIINPTITLAGGHACQGTSENPMCSSPLAIPEM